MNDKVLMDNTRASSKNPRKIDLLVEKIKSHTFWAECSRIKDILLHPTNLINVFERDTCDLSKVYPRFQALKNEFSSTPFLNSIVLARWNFINTESMSFAYLFTPVGASAKWFNDDYIQAKIRFKERVKHFYGDDQDKLKACEKEIQEFLVQMNDTELSPCLKEEYFSIDGKSYWSQYGRKDYPLLSKVIAPLFTVPTSSAAAERVWSIFTWIHSKKRNRLAMDKVEKLVYIYVNSALLDSMDKTDYFEDPDSDSDESAIGIA